MSEQELTKVENEASSTTNTNNQNDEEEISKEEIQSNEPLLELNEEQEERYQLMRSVGEECLKENELRSLIKNKKDQIRCYDGFEPSGRIHIAQGVMKAINVNKLTKSGCKFIFLVADWFAMMNNKMGGDLKKIRIVGEYMIEVWKSIGMNLENVEFVWSSEVINEKANEYWSLVLDIATRNNLKRILRCSQIMGRKQTDDLSAAQVLYPMMQCADIFFLKADICQLGLDQRKVNVLAREYCDICKPKRKFKPVILSHHMLLGLTGDKMSKSNPKSAIFMEDTETDVNSKIKGAFCAPNIVENNPVLEYIKYVVFPWFNKFELKRKEKDGGDKIYDSYDVLEQEYKDGLVHPGDLKPSLAKELNKILQPVRDHFKNDNNARKLLAQVKKFKVTK